MQRTLVVALTAIILTSVTGLNASGAVVDEIVLKSKKMGNDGLTIFGRIREVEKDKVWVIVSDGDNEGPISVPRARIRRIEYDLDGRRAELPAGDAAARYKFALWELSLGRKEEARFDLEAVVGKPGVPPEAMLLLAKLQEEAGSLRKALASYNGYLHTNPTDKTKTKAAKKAIKRLKPRVEAIAVVPPDKQPEKIPANPPVGNGEIRKPIPVVTPAKPKIVEGLEIYPGGWTSVPWADPATVTKEVDDETGNQFLAIGMSGTGKGSQRKTAIQLRVGRTKRAVIKSPKLTFYVYNPGNHTLPISVAFQTGKAMTYVESRTFRFNRKGWHTVSLDLNSKYFKSAKTDWGYKTAIKDKDDLKGLIILIGTRRKQTVYLDYIKFTQ